MSDQKEAAEIVNEISKFAEWRGAVKEALKHLAAESVRHEKTTDTIWDTIKTVQRECKDCRERCDRVSSCKIEKDVLKNYDRSIAGIKEDLKDDIDHVKEDIGGIQDEVKEQGKLQIRQQVTIAFYGMIGGALFSLILFLGNALLRKLSP